MSVDELEAFGREVGRLAAAESEIGKLNRLLEVVVVAEQSEPADRTPDV